MKTLFDIDQFAYPWLLLLLAVIPIYLGWYFLYYNKRRLVIRLSYNPAKLKTPQAYIATLRHLPLIFQMLGLATLILALARPQTASQVVERNAEGIDIMLVMDVSGSMEEHDFDPNRLEVAKENAISFIKGRNGDRMGMVLFAEDAFSYAPLTLDYTWLQKMIGDIRFDIIPKQGTAIGSALSVGLNRMRDSKSPSKVMILFTDGENNRGEMDPITAARLAALYHVKIYTIGIGKKSYIRSSFEGDKKVMSDIDEASLEKIAKLTNGKFYRAEDAKTLKNIFSEISAMEKTSINEDIYKDVQDVYPFFLKCTIVFLGITFILMLTFMYNPLEQ